VRVFLSEAPARNLRLVSLGVTVSRRRARFAARAGGLARVVDDLSSSVDWYSTTRVARHSSRFVLAAEVVAQTSMGVRREADSTTRLEAVLIIYPRPRRGACASSPDVGTAAGAGARSLAKNLNHSRRLDSVERGEFSPVLGIALCSRLSSPESDVRCLELRHRRLKVRRAYRRANLKQVAARRERAQSAGRKPRALENCCSRSRQGFAGRSPASFRCYFGLTLSIAGHLGIAYANDRESRCFP